MSTFTTELRFMLESWNNQSSTGNASQVNNVINNTRTQLFDFDYPHSSLTNSEKEHLEKHFMLHYYTREIGFETFGLFKVKLQSKLWDIMPKYEKLYALEHLNLDFFSDVDYTRKLDSQTDLDGFNSKMTGSVDHQNSGSSTNTTTGGWKDETDKDSSETTTGSIEREDTTQTDLSKDGKVIDTTEFGKVVTQSGSEIDEKTGHDDKNVTGSIEKTIDFGKESTETGGYQDQTQYGKTETTSGGYTDTFTGDQRNLHSDTPQSEVNLNDASTGYISDLQKRIDNLETQRVYDDQEAASGGSDTTTRTFQNQKTTEGGNQTETTVYGGPLTPYQEEMSYNSTNTKSFDQRASTDSGDEVKTTEFDDYKETTENSGAITETYNNLKKEFEDDSEVTRTYQNLQVVDQNNKKLVDTYQNLLNEIDRTDIVDLTERIYGNVNGNNIEKFIKYKDNILNIELMIIKDLNSLFMGLWA